VAGWIIWSISDWGSDVELVEDMLKSNDWNLTCRFSWCVGVETVTFLFGLGLLSCNTSLYERFLYVVFNGILHSTLITGTKWSGVQVPVVWDPVDIHMKKIGCAFLEATRGLNTVFSIGMLLSRSPFTVGYTDLIGIFKTEDKAWIVQAHEKLRSMAQLTTASL
jgi:hypothetical protein